MKKVIYIGEIRKDTAESPTYYPYETLVLVEKLNDTYSRVKKCGRGNHGVVLMRNTDIKEC